MKRILIVTQYIYPENFKSNDLMFELETRGYKVDVLTGIPNYPEGVFYDGYGIFKRRIERIRNITIYRCLQFPRGRKSNWFKLLSNYLSFCFFGTLWILFFLSWKKKYDAIIVHEPSPITQLIPACILGIIRNTPVYSWIMDIWPDSIKLFCGERNYNLLRPVLTKVTEWCYRHSDKILITSRGFEKLICRHHDYKNKIVYFPNWSVDMSVIDPTIKLPPLPQGFRIMFAGNIGSGQDFDSVCKCMSLLKEHKDIKWIFIGDGSKRHYLEEFIADNDLSDTAFVLGKYPAKAMPSFYQQADALFASLNGGYEFLDLTVPAKIQSYMSAGKPILAMLGEGPKQLIDDAGCGYCVGGGDYRAMADIIEKDVLPHKDSFEKMGFRGRIYYEKYFTLNNCIDNIELLFRNNNPK